jgi:hypothetical protein
MLNRPTLKDLDRANTTFDSPVAIDPVARPVELLTLNLSAEEIFKGPLGTIWSPRTQPAITRPW